MQSPAHRAPRAAALDGHRAPRRRGRRARRSSRPARKDEVALAFCINGDVDGPARREFIELLPRTFEDDPPDLILLETITLIRDRLTLAAIEALVATGHPGVDQLPPLPPRRVRRLRPALGRPGGRRVRPRRPALRGARRARRCSSTACRPTTCRACCRGCATSPTCRSASTPTSATTPTTAGASTRPSTASEYAEMAAAWREEGAQIIGGCCGVRPEHIAGARERACATCRPARAPRPRPPTAAADGALDRGLPRRASPRPWTDERGRRLYPLADARDRRASPASSCPTQGSFLVWKYLFQQRHRRGQALPRHRLRHRPARHRSSRATAPSTCTRSTSTAARWPTRSSNAFRNGVADRITGRGVDLYPWVPKDALRRRRREPLPDARRPVRAAQQPPPARLLGPQPARPPVHAAAQAAGRRRRRLRHAALDPRPGAHGRAAGRAAASSRASSTSRSSPSTRSSSSARTRSSASRSSPTPTTCASATRTSWSPTCSRSPPHDEPHRVPVHLRVGHRGPPGQGRRPDLRRRPRRGPARGPASAASRARRW